MASKSQQTLCPVTLAADCLYEVYSLDELTDDFPDTLVELQESFPHLSRTDAVRAMYLAAHWHNSVGHQVH